jgi:hypothetical protein
MWWSVLANMLDFAGTFEPKTAGAWLCFSDDVTELMFFVAVVNTTSNKG